MNESNENFKRYQNLYSRFKKFNESKIPLCAAENYTSNFVKNALFSEWNGKYCLSNENFNT